MENSVCKLFGIKYPIVQGGMVWCSGWRLASAVSNAGGLGLLGAGSMSIDVFKDQLMKCKKATNKPFGVNLPLTERVAPYIDHIIEEKVAIVFTSAGNPKLWTEKLKSHGIVVAHVVPSAKLALKCQAAGVDAVVAEGFEAGGHNGIDENTTLTLIPRVRRALDPRIPLIAAGGIGTGATMLAAMALGADGVQIGTRFALTQESSCSEACKQRILQCTEGETVLTMKNFLPVRLLLNDFGKAAKALSDGGASREELLEFCGRGKTRLAMMDGDVANGEVVIGQNSADFADLPTAGEVVERVITEFSEQNKRLSSIHF